MTVASAPAEPATPVVLAAKIHGCLGYTKTEISTGARLEGQCDLPNGDLVDIATFADQDSRDTWLKLATAFGGVYVVGDSWVVSVISHADAQTVQGDLGGDVR